MLSKSWSKAPYELAPTTARRAMSLSRKYGYDNTQDMAASLPEGADVLDVGAGLSNLGKKIARLRPDVSWTNVDLRYDRISVSARARFLAPDNLHVVSGDALTLIEQFGAERFDRVYSWWLMPHINMAGLEIAEEAATNMIGVTRYGGQVAVGPRFDPDQGEQALICPISNSEIVSEEQAYIIAESTRLPLFRQVHQQMGNELYQFPRRLGL